MPLDLSKLMGFGLNIGCHVFILLLFLTAFFFLYVGKLTAAHVDSELHDLISKQTQQFMQSVDQADKNHVIDWHVVNTMAAVGVQRSQGTMAYIQQHNNQLVDSAFCALVMLGVGLVLLAVYCLVRGIDIRLRFLIVENLVIFAFVGMIEFYFFMNIASQYVPVLPDDALRAVQSELITKLSGT